MRWNRTWLLVVALLLSVLSGGLVVQEAKAQVYTLEIEALQRTFTEFGLGRTLELGQDIVVVGQLTVVLPPSVPDTVLVTVVSPDPNVPDNFVPIPIPVSTLPNTVFTFAIQQLTLVPGDFTVTGRSSQVGDIITPLTFPVPSYVASIGISSLAGEVGTQFLVTTAIDVGLMSEVRTRFDIEYVLDGAPLRQSHFVILFGPVQVIVNEDLTFQLLTYPQTEDQKTWRTTQPFTLSPGAHTLTVRVFDQSLGLLAANKTFSIQVADQVGALETRVDEMALEVGDQIDTLTGQVEDANSRAANAELASATASSLAIISFIALGLAVVVLLIQFGILKLGRFGRRGQE